MTITLNLAEQKLAQFLAGQRHAVNRAAGTDNKRVGPQSDEQTDLEGIGAEIAFCALFNIYPDTSLAPRQGGHDAVLWGRTIDVKATTYNQGRLLAVPSKKDNQSEAYALMVGVFPTYAFRGFASAKQLLQADRLVDLGHGPTYALDQGELKIPNADDIEW